jgi:hypothetical protein
MRSYLTRPYVLSTRPPKKGLRGLSEVKTCLYWICFILAVLLISDSPDQRSPQQAQASANRHTGTQRAPTAVIALASSPSNARSPSSDSDTPLLFEQKKRSAGNDTNGLRRQRRRHTAVNQGTVLFQGSLNDMARDIDDLWFNMSGEATKNTIFKTNTKNSHDLHKVKLQAHDKDIEKLSTAVTRRDGLPTKLEALRVQVKETDDKQQCSIKELQQEIRVMRLTIDETVKKGIADRVQEITGKSWRKSTLALHHRKRTMRRHQTPSVSPSKTSLNVCRRSRVVPRKWFTQL